MFEIVMAAAQALPPEQIPSVFHQVEFWLALVGLAGSALAAMRSMMGQMLKQQAAREIAERKEWHERNQEIVRAIEGMAATMRMISVTLTNHVSEDARVFSNQSVILSNLVVGSQALLEIAKDVARFVAEERALRGRD